MRPGSELEARGDARPRGMAVSRRLRKEAAEDRIRLTAPLALCPQRRPFPAERPGRGDQFLGKSLRENLPLGPIEKRACVFFAAVLAVDLADETERFAVQGAGPMLMAAHTGYARAAN